MNQTALSNAIDRAKLFRLMFLNMDADQLQKLPEGALMHLLEIWSSLADDLCEALDEVQS